MRKIAIAALLAIALLTLHVVPRPKGTPEEGLRAQHRAPVKG